MHTYTVQTSKGPVTRRTNTVYEAASETEGGQVRFHRTTDAAAKAAGAYGRVHSLEQPEGAADTYTPVLCYNCGKTTVKLRCEHCGF